MKGLIQRTKSFIVNEDGPTATEYAVMLALIIIAALVAITGLGATVTEIFSSVDTSLQSAMDNGGTGTGTGT
jgi:pilus assembly protein Flp/PilA